MVVPFRVELTRRSRRSTPIGSGDSLVAGLVDAQIWQGLDPATTLRRAVATAAANALVWDAGAIDPVVVARLEEQVEVVPTRP